MAYFRMLQIGKQELYELDFELGDVFDCMTDVLLDKVEEDEYIVWHGIQEEGDSWRVALITYEVSLQQDKLPIRVSSLNKKSTAWKMVTDSEQMDSEIY